MTSVYDTTIQISKDENALRKEESTITDEHVHTVQISHLAYDDKIPYSKVVLTGAKNRETINDADFNKEFSKKTHDLLTYVSWDNVVVAGGSLVNIITKSKDKLNDVDLFVYGLEKNDAIKKIDQIIDHIKQKANDMNYETRVYMNKNVINIYVFDTRKLLQIQIILRLYDNLAKVLMGFDVDCCSVAYNGKNILVTKRGEWALKHRVNVANLNRRSPSYENRLIKYSFRGFDVITDFDYEKAYNKMFFMSSDNMGFTRLLEQELINNGQLKNIIFSNTLRFRKKASYTSGISNYQKENLEIKNIKHTANSITRYNANIEDDSMKFREYSMSAVDIMENNVMDQLTGSFDPITDEEWINTDPDGDPLGRSEEYLALKYNTYSSVTDFDNVVITDMSNLDTKCLAVIYVDNDDDVVRIIDSKYVHKSTNMYKINHVHLAILLGRTKLAIRLMKGHSYETYKELIYMMDNDKLFTNYCNATGRNCTDIDKALVEKYHCVNISDNIHNQNKGNDKLDLLYKQAKYDMLMTIARDYYFNEYQSVDLSQLPYEAIRLLYEKNGLTLEYLKRHVIRKHDKEEKNKLIELLDDNEQRILNFAIYCFNKKESKKCKKTSDNIIKILKLKNQWDDKYEYASAISEYNKFYGNLYTCMMMIDNEELDAETITKLVGTGKSYDIMVGFAIFMDKVDLVKKLIDTDSRYVKLKYYYDITDSPKVQEYFNSIEKARLEDKKKVNEFLKNNNDHVNAINDGDLPEEYERRENVFGMTPDDNIVSKLLLLYNKVFNKRDRMNDKDLTTLQNMRRAVHNIRRDSELNRVDSEYFYSLDLHNLFFSKSDKDKDSVVDEDTSEMADEDLSNEEELLDMKPKPKRTMKSFVQHTPRKKTSGSKKYSKESVSVKKVPDIEIDLNDEDDYGSEDEGTSNFGSECESDYDY